MSQIELTTLGESCEFYNGKAHEKSIDENGKYIVVNSKFISQEGRVIKRTKDQMYPLFKGDIVMVMSDVPNGKALAKCFIIDKDDNYSLNQRICCIRSKEFDTKYLYYQLNRNEHFLAFNNGENQTNLRKDDILACPLIKPSIEEQRRMVVELDDAFIALSKANTNVNSNLINAAELFASFLQSFFENKEETWEGKTLGEVCNFTQGIQRDIKLQSEVEGENQIRFLRIIDFTQGDEPPRYIDNPGLRYILDEDDISIVRYGASTGFVCRGLKGALANNLFRVIPKSEKLITRGFLYVFLKSSIFQNVVKQSMNGAAMPAISFGLIKDIPVPIIPLDEQEEIVAKYKRLSLETEKIKNRYQIKLEILDELKSGILKRAFENELTEAEL